MINTFTDVVGIIAGMQSYEYDSRDYITFGITDDEDNSILSSLSIERVKFGDKIFNTCKFEGLDFNNCNFTSTYFRSCHFYNCKFTSCSFEKIGFTETTFQDCQFLESTINSSTIYESQFKDCFVYKTTIVGNLLSHTRFTACVVSDFHLKRLTVAHLVIERTVSSNDGFMFFDASITNCHFMKCQLNTSRFLASNFRNLTFTDCVLNNNTFGDSNLQKENLYNYIDFQTIIKSENLSLKVLQEHFNIHSDDVKDYVKTMVTEFEFQSVFISYSFKDSDFAHRLNDELTKAGVLTYIWKLDAPGGKRLKDIMSENINKKDRLLFIASEHSIKSVACQFELTQGRKKQEESWSDVFYPIHIDNYLFNVKKDHIKPKSVQDEYWENIQEIIEFNSMDFSEYINSDFGSLTFEKKINQLMASLKKKKGI